MTSQHNINIDVDGKIKDNKGNEFIITEPTLLRPYYVVKITLANEEIKHPSSDVIANAVAAINSDRAQEQDQEEESVINSQEEEKEKPKIYTPDEEKDAAELAHEIKGTTEEASQLEETTKIKEYIKLMLQEMKLWWSESNGKLPNYKKQIIKQITDNELYNKYTRQIKDAYDYGVCYIYDNRPKGYLRNSKPSSIVLFDINNWDNYKENKEGILEQYKLTELINDTGKPSFGGKKKRTRRLRKSLRKREKKSRTKLRK
jgi:hypothetical protein